ncbi:MAG: transporter substrate-binding domain-containing protein [Chloroflexota bacterium]
MSNFVLSILLTTLCLLGQSPQAHAQIGSRLGSIVVAVSENSPPFSARASNGQLVGFSVDLMRMIERTAGLRVVYEYTPFENLITGVNTQLYDAAISCLFITDERSKLVYFSEPYFTTGPVLIVYETENLIFSLDDITSDVKISTSNNSTSQDIIRTQTEGEFIESQFMTEAMEKIISGVTNAAVIDELGAAQYINQNNAPLKIISGLLSDNECAIAINKDNITLQRQINLALERLQNNGQFLSLYRHWFGSRPITGPRDFEPIVRHKENDTSHVAPSGELDDTSLTDETIGQYSIVLDTDPPLFQLIQLAADGTWFEADAAVADYRQTKGHLLSESEFALQTGVWQLITRNPLATKIELSASVVLTGSIYPPVPIVEFSLPPPVAEAESTTTEHTPALTKKSDSETIDSETIDSETIDSETIDDDIAGVANYYNTTGQIAKPDTTDIISTIEQTDAIVDTAVEFQEQSIYAMATPLIEQRYIYPYKEYQITLLEDGSIYGFYTLHEGKLPTVLADSEILSAMQMDILTRTMIVTQVIEFSGKMIYE